MAAAKNISFTFFQVLYKYYHFSLGITMRKIFRVHCEGTCQKDFTRNWNFHSSVFGILNTKVKTNFSVDHCT